MLIAGVLAVFVTSVAMLDTLEGPTLLPGDGRLATALDSITIQPEQEVEGTVKFPLYVEPAARTIVSPQLALLMSFCNVAASPSGTFHRVPVGTGMVRSTVACGRVGSSGPADAIVMLDDFCAVCPAESFKKIVNVGVPARVGVPPMAPAEVSRLRPGGNA